MKNILLCLFTAIFLVGCDVPTVEERTNLENQLANLRSKIESTRNDLHELYAKRRALKAEDDGITTTNVITNVITITNVVTSVEPTFDGRVTGRITIENQFKTYQIFMMPYSSHEFIFKSEGHVYYGYSTGKSTNVDQYFRIFE